MTRKALTVVAVCLLVAGLSGMTAESEKEQAAVMAAEKWVALVDSEKYAESWEEAAELLRNAVDQGQWRQAIHALRQPLGTVLSRAVKSATYKTALPGAPDGEYVVIEFETTFEHKKTAIETVTPLMEQDGSWRVSGYYLK